MKTLDFIFMLTRADRTVADAQERVATVLAAGVRHIGFKDVGLPFNELAALGHAIRAGGATTYLEVVSLDAASERASAKMAVRLGVDVLMGGTRPDLVGPVLSESSVCYYPFPGTVVGHPSMLVGSIDTIAASVAARPDVDGSTCSHIDSPATFRHSSTRSVVRSHRSRWSLPARSTGSSGS